MMVLALEKKQAVVGDGRTSYGRLCYRFVCRCWDVNNGLFHVVFTAA
jgi:hypothetical protein